MGNQREAAADILGYEYDWLATDINGLVALFIGERSNDVKFGLAIGQIVGGVIATIGGVGSEVLGGAATVSGVGADRHQVETPYSSSP
jgi:hypothetical protein